QMIAEKEVRRLRSEILKLDTQLQDIKAISDLRSSLRDLRRTELEQPYEDVLKGIDRKVVATQRELKESEERYRQMFEQNRAVQLLIDPDTGEIVDANSAAADFYGYTLEQLKQLKISDINPLPHEAIAEEIVRAVTEHRKYFLLTHRLSSGETREVEVYSGPVTLKGRILLYSIVLDITERKRAQEALRNSENQFRAIFDHAMDAIVLADNESNFLDINGAACKLFDLPRQELLGRKLIQMVEPDKPDHMEAGWREFLQQGERKGESYVLWPDGSKREFEYSAKSDFIPGRHLIILHDTTEQRRLREQLFQSEKLSAVGELVAGVAHELNNPLTSVVGFSQLLMTDPTISQQNRGLLETVVNESLRARKIIQNLLTFARRSKQEHKPVKLADVIEKTLELRRYDLRVGNIEVTTDIPRNLPLITGDFMQLQQVILNLVTNAEQAMREHSNSGKLFVKLRQSDQDLIISIEDTGPGIPPENLRKVFEPFFTTKPVGKGTGLGLAICYGIIAEHGGEITVDSKVGRGTTFTITLPVSNEEPTATAEATKSKPVSAKRILALDDEPAIRALIKSALTRQGHDVDAVSTGEEALKLLRSKKYDLIFSDMRMPGMDGPSFFEFLKTEFPSLTNRVIFITGDTVSGETAEFLRQTGCASLSKPFVVADLLTLMAEVSSKI
ncbi:MAG TPA: PAS domain S-box protein, partial [Blastocatellia bacterium]|nr:PAS domain S-box protein [Blastocatellia bacterium]